MVKAVLAAAGVQAPQGSVAAGSATAHQLPDLNNLEGASPDEVVAAMQSLTGI
jgi:hypothetical protein